MRRRIAVVLTLFVFTSSVHVGAVDGKKAEYTGGTISGLPDKTSGRFDTGNDTTLVFTPDKKGIAPTSIPYAAITELEYGQKAGVVLV